MKKIAVVTGATGMIGVELTRVLGEGRYDVCAVVRPGSKNAGRLAHGEGVKIIELDALDLSPLPSMIDHADVFFHLAWDGTRPPMRDDGRLQESNYAATLIAIQVADELGCDVFVGCGSQAEYGALEPGIDETREAAPNTEYGKNKLRAGLDGERLALEMGMRFVWPRIFSVYGRYDHPDTLIMSGLKKLAANENMDMTPCVQMWDYLNVSDAAGALITLAQPPARGTYNVASGQARPLKDFVSDMRDVTGSSSELRFGAIPYGPSGPMDMTPSVDRLKSLGWQPLVSFNEGIRRMIAAGK